MTGGENVGEACVEAQAAGGSPATSGRRYRDHLRRLRPIGDLVPRRARGPWRAADRHDQSIGPEDVLQSLPRTRRDGRQRIDLSAGAPGAARLALVTLTLTAGGRPALAEDYKDPAIALCEKATRSSYTDDDKILSMSSKIDGADVVVDYKVSILGTKPKDRISQCRFRLDERLHAFVVAPIVTTSSVSSEECERRSGVYRDQEVKFFLGPQPPSSEVTAAYNAALAGVDECHAAKAANPFEQERADFLDREWRKTGIYPIPAEETKLGQ